VEVRVADVCLDAGTAVLLAGLTRALVATALAEARRGTPAAAAPARQVAAALATAARHGLTGAGADPVTGQPADAPALRARLLDHVYPALSDHGDTETITRLLRRLDDRGTGAGEGGDPARRGSGLCAWWRPGLRARGRSVQPLAPAMI
jgi:glutamate---cysteine ligase / carboxylate-amine ligase